MRIFGVTFPFPAMIDPKLRNIFQNNRIELIIEQIDPFCLGRTFNVDPAIQGYSHHTSANAGRVCLADQVDQDLVLSEVWRLRIINVSSRRIRWQI